MSALDGSEIVEEVVANPLGKALFGIHVVGGSVLTKMLHIDRETGRRGESVISSGCMS